jgi:cyclic beta-1,2-glucan synthetase
VERGFTQGPHGLPLIGTGDWNDGMNRVGSEGRGESVWLAWFLIEVLQRMARLAEGRQQPDLAEDYRQKADRLAQRVEQSAWDGAWYLRAFFDNGQPLGTSRASEGWIDSLPQSWSVLSGAAQPERADLALQSSYRHLVRRQENLVLLFTPPFEDIEPSPGYIRGYPPGVRENGGQYTHAAIWLAMAAARQGQGDRAVDILRMLNPIEHAKDVYSVWRYVVEPYVVAADVYRLAGKVGHGGWSWYTGSAAWMYRAWIEEVLGLKLQAEFLQVDPVIPEWWDGFKIRYRHGQAVYWIEVTNPDGVNRGVQSVHMDGRLLRDGRIPLEDKAIKHRVQVKMG